MVAVVAPVVTTTTTPLALALTASADRGCEKRSLECRSAASAIEEPTSERVDPCAVDHQRDKAHLTFATEPMYDFYVRGARIVPLLVVEDQQL